jgi:hypothetical protein
MIVSGLSDCPFTGEDRRRQKKGGGRVFHLVSYKWFRRTQFLPILDVNYNVWGILLCEVS